MAKGENVGKPGSPGWQKTDKSKLAGKTPPVSDVPVVDTSAFPAARDPGVQWLANGLGMTEWLNSLSDQVIWDSYAPNIEASAVWDSYAENLEASAIREAYENFDEDSDGADAAWQATRDMAYEVPAVQPRLRPAMTDSQDRMSCPNGCNLQGPAIPQEYIDKGYYGEGVTHYSRMVGVEIPGVYDGVAYWHCPDCGVDWHRWQEGDSVRDRVDRYMESQRPPGFTVGQ